MPDYTVEFSEAPLLDTSSLSCDTFFSFDEALLPQEENSSPFLDLRIVPSDELSLELPDELDLNLLDDLPEVPTDELISLEIPEAPPEVPPEPPQIYYEPPVEESEESEESEEEEEEEEKKERVCRPEKWKQNVRKREKNQGRQYLARTGAVVPQKEMGPACKCKMRCYKRIGEENCLKIFQNFWKLGDYSVQNAYIAGCVRIMRPKMYDKPQKDPPKPGRRSYSRCFYVNVNGIDTEICKQAFLNMHTVSNGRLDRLLKKKQTAGNTGTDARGRHGNKANRIAFDRIQDVRRSIDDFRRFAGYTHKSSENVVEIIPAPYTIRTMYRNYCQELESEGKTPVSEFRYRKILNSEYNIDFAERYQTPFESFQKDFESHATQTAPPNDQIVYTSQDCDGNTLVGFNPDMFGNCDLSTQGWTFATPE